MDRRYLARLPHPKSVIAGVVGFDIGPVLTLCLFGLSEVIAGFLFSVRICVPLLESGSSSLYLSVDVYCTPWLLVGICTYCHKIVDALINEAGDRSGELQEHIPVCAS